MFLIWGSRWREREEVPNIDSECVVCKETDMRILSMRRWFTFFFVPLFPTSSKRLYFECLCCENSYKIKDSISLDDLLEESSFDQE